MERRQNKHPNDDRDTMLYYITFVSVMVRHVQKLQKKLAPLVLAVATAPPSRFYLTFISSIRQNDIHLLADLFPTSPSISFIKHIVTAQHEKREFFLLHTIMIAKVP